MRRLIEPSHLDLCCLQKVVIIACDSERVNSSSKRFTTASGGWWFTVNRRLSCRGTKKTRHNKVASVSDCLPPPSLIQWRSSRNRLDTIFSFFYSLILTLSGQFQQTTNWLCFSYFVQGIGFDIPCKLSLNEMLKAYFLGKTRKKKKKKKKKKDTHKKQQQNNNNNNNNKKTIKRPSAELFTRDAKRQRPHPDLVQSKTRFLRRLNPEDFVPGIWTSMPTVQTPTDLFGSYFLFRHRRCQVSQPALRPARNIHSYK